MKKVSKIITLFSVLDNERASLVAQTVKRLPAMWETGVRFLGREDPLEKEMAIHSSTLAWKMLWTEEPDRLQSMGSQRVRHDWVTSLSLYCILLIQYVPCSVYCIFTTYFITESFYLLISFTYFAICLPASSLETISLFSISMSLL